MMGSTKEDDSLSRLDDIPKMPLGALCGLNKSLIKSQIGGKGRRDNERTSWQTRPPKLCVTKITGRLA